MDKEAMEWATKIFKVDLKRMIKDGIIKKREIVDTYKRAVENGKVDKEVTPCKNVTPATTE